MESPSLLYGLNPRQSLLALWKLMFSRPLQLHFGAEWSLGWCEDLLRAFIAEDREGFSAQYNELARQVEPLVSGDLRPSMSNLPWGMMSLDMRVGLVPWVTPLFEHGLMMLLSTGTAREKGFGEVLPIAFFRSAGPGSEIGNAIRISAPSQAARASAEHWLMRAYLNRKSTGVHATLRPNDTERIYSRHHYRDAAGARKAIYFDATDSWGREEDDFKAFLEEGVPVA